MRHYIVSYLPLAVTISTVCDYFFCHTIYIANHRGQSSPMYGAPLHSLHSIQAYIPVISGLPLLLPYKCNSRSPC